MNRAAVVGKSDRVGHIREHREPRLEARRPSRAPVRERESVDVLERDERPPVADRSGVDQPRDRAVLEPGEKPRLAERRIERRATRVRPHEFQRNPPRERAVLDGQKDIAEGA